MSKLLIFLLEKIGRGLENVPLWKNNNVAMIFMGSKNDGKYYRREIGR